jgi:hypothetical protein
VRGRAVPSAASRSHPERPTLGAAATSRPRPTVAPARPQPRTATERGRSQAARDRSTRAAGQPTTAGARTASAATR